MGGKSLNFKKQLRQARIRAWIKAQQREKSVLLGRQVYWFSEEHGGLVSSLVSSKAARGLV